MSAIVEPISAKAESLPVCLIENPYRLVSLKDMLTVLAGDLTRIWPDLQNLWIGYGETPGDENAATVEEARETLQRLIKVCDGAGWKDLGRQAKRLLERAEDKNHGAEMQALSDDLTRAFEQKTIDTHILIIEEKDTDIFKNAVECLCGKVHDDLSISQEELNLSGKALAVGLSTAAVSHAMRSVEASLHVVCTALGIDFSGGNELQDWKNLTDRIKKVIDGWEAKPRSQKKAEAQKRLSQLLIPADGFRLAWRNHVAHAREKYEYDEAKKILGHVADFLKNLSVALVP